MRYGSLRRGGPMPEITLRAKFHREREQWIGWCPDLEVATQGDTRQEARENLCEAVSLFLETCHEMGTLDEVLRDTGGVPERRPVAASDHELTDAEIAVLRRGRTATTAAVHPDPLEVHGAELAAILPTALSPAEVAGSLGISPGHVRRTIRSGALFAVRIGGRWRVPRFQFGSDGLVPNIAAVNAAAPRTLDPVSLVRWYSTPDADLPGPDGRALSPLDWLRAGRAPAPLIAIVREL